MKYQKIFFLLSLVFLLNSAGCTSTEKKTESLDIFKLIKFGEQAVEVLKKKYENKSIKIPPARAALFFETEDSQTSQEIWNQLLKKTATINISDSTQKGKALAVYNWLKTVLLLQYHATSESMILFIEDGVYNCITSVLMYNYLLEENGVTAYPVIMKGHVFSRFFQNNKQIDVELTVDNGFDPARSRMELMEFNSGGSRHLDYVKSVIPFKNKSKPELLLNDWKLLGELLYLKGVNFHGNKMLFHALSAFLSAYILKPKEPRFSKSLDIILQLAGDRAYTLGEYEKAFLIFMTSCKLGLSKKESLHNLSVTWLQLKNLLHKQGKTNLLKKLNRQMLKIQKDHK